MAKPKTIDKRGSGGVTSIALPKMLKTALDTVSKRDGVSKGHIVREALRRWLESYDRWTHEEGRVLSSGG